jgi:hypothetical protein
MRVPFKISRNVIFLAKNCEKVGKFAILAVRD